MKDFSFQHPASSIQHPASSIQHPASSIQHPASSIQHPASSYWLTSPDGSYHQSQRIRTIVSARRKLWERETTCSQKISQGRRSSSLFNGLISAITLIALVLIGSIWVDIIQDILSRWVLS